MKRKSYGLGTKIILVLLFFMGLCMIANLAFVFGETEEVEGVVEHTYMSGATNGTKPANAGRSEVPMCRVVWYDKDGVEVVYGMPNDKGYEVGDIYYVQVDAKTNRIPKRSTGEGVVAVTIGVVMCTVSVVIWRKKFGKPKRQTSLSEIEQRRREAYDLETYLPIIRCSICNGEQVAGFKDKRTGQFTEVMLIRNDKDLEEFKVRYGVEKVVKEY